MMGILGNLAAFGSSATPANFDAIDKEIKAGLKNERKRMDVAREARDYYEGRFEPYMTDYGRILAIRDNAPNRRTIPYVRSIIDAKIRRLYMADPKRTITDNPEATEYLNSLYSKGRVTPKLKDSLTYAALGGVCAIQVELNQPKTDGETQATLAAARPAVNFRLWAADEFAVWCSPDEPLTPYAVAVLDRYDAKTRCRLWTPDVLAVYESKKWDGSGNTSGTRIFEPVSAEPNFLGLVPFAFTWWREPTKDFWTWCPGPELVEVNDQANARLSKIADDTIFTRPMTFSRNVREDWTPPDRIQAGQILKLPAMVETIGDGTDGPSLETTMVDLSYLASDREELEAHLELQGEMHGVPKEQWRLRGGNAASGVSIIAEQLPIIEECEARQILMESTEKDLALVTLMTVSRWLGDMPGAASVIGPINAAIDNFDMSVQWTPLTKNRPGPDYDQHQQFELINGMVSVVQAIMESKGMTEAEAIEHIAKKAEHDALIASMAPPMPEPAAEPNAEPQPETEDEQPEEQPEEDTEE
jgi:hypothetical protein